MNGTSESILGGAFLTSRRMQGSVAAARAFWSLGDPQGDAGGPLFGRTGRQLDGTFVVCPFAGRKGTNLSVPSFGDWSQIIYDPTPRSPATNSVMSPRPEHGFGCQERQPGLMPGSVGTRSRSRRILAPSPAS